MIACAVVQHPEDKPCIDDWGQRVQAFVGCSRAAGGDAKMAGYFVFLVDVPTEDIHDGLIQLGAKPKVHYSIQEGQRRAGLKPSTKPEDYLQGDPVVLSIFWKQGDGWIERPYQSFVDEQVMVDDQPVTKPWTPHFVFHGSGAIHHSGTGCIACPCDCPGGIIADNRFPVYNPKPTVRFNWSAARSRARRCTSESVRSPAAEVELCWSPAFRLPFVRQAEAWTPTIRERNITDCPQLRTNHVPIHVAPEPFLPA